MIRFTILAATAVAAIALTGCDRHAGAGNGTDISFSSNDADGAVSGGIDKDGNLRINANGFNADVRLPRIALDANNFDMNGVHLYPGSTISSINVAGQDGDREDDKGKVAVAFTSPAAAATVRDWLNERLAKAGYKLSAAGNGLTGTTDKGQSFALKLDDDGAGKSKGAIEIGK